MRTRILNKMTAREVEEYLARGGDTIFVGTGVTEVHGNLPVDCESIISEAFAAKLAILPLICLSLGGIAGVCRQTRSSMLEAIRQDYVRTARSKGLKENFIIAKHVLRNGLVPIITMIGGRLASMVGGSVFVENVFGIPGMGSLMINSVNNVDIPMMQACVMLTALVISVAYLITDFLYVAVDPRITMG